MLGASGPTRRYVCVVQFIQSVGWNPAGNALRILDQTLLPESELVLDLVQVRDVVEAIQSLRVRGAPAIGVAAAIGMVVAFDDASLKQKTHNSRALLQDIADQIAGARPTAVNLAWAVNRMLHVADTVSDDVLASALRTEAQRILHEDVVSCQRIGEYGESLIADGARVMTHCNAGALATAGIGTALAPVYVAQSLGRASHVYANETRPLRQGARLTAWELSRAGIEVTVLPDGAAASLLRDGAIDLVIVGADRIAKNGDVANKIGTYPLALAAHAHGVPFYVAAPYSSFDFATLTGTTIRIEQRAASELLPLPAGVNVYNPAFDVTPAELITAYITDRGLFSGLFSGTVFPVAPDAEA